MSSEEMLHVLILQLRNNFTLSKEEESILSVLQLHGGGINMPSNVLPKSNPSILQKKMA